MSRTAVTVMVPDLGGVEDVRVVEILVAPGERVTPEQPLVTLESDKASMDVPSPVDGVVDAIPVAAGAEVKEGEVLVVLEAEAAELEAGSERGDPQGVAAETGAEVEGPSQPPPGRDAASGGPLPASDSTSRVTSETAERVGLVVLGGGPGGYTAAFRAADLGQQVLLVERYPSLGGVCLHVGCIPSKALLHVARVMDEAAALAEHGVRFGAPEIDLGRLRSWKASVVDRLSGGLGELARRRGIEVVHGTGRLASPHRLEVAAAAGSRSVEFERCILATGSRNVELPELPNADPRVMDSTTALELSDVPRRLLVIGGGVIGLEMATVYGSLGAELTVVELLDGLLPEVDRDLVRPLQRRLERRLGARLLLSTRVVGVKARKNGLEVTFEGPDAPRPTLFDRVLVAVGRRPNSDGLGLEAAGVSTDDRGFIRVDGQMRTSVPHLLAIGDLTGPPLLAHKATHQGKVAAEVAAGGKSHFDARAIAAVAFTDPEIAWVGLTETEARKRSEPFEVARFPWSASGRALGMGRTDGFTKLLFEPTRGRLLGGGIVGPGAGDLISEVALALEMDCEAADLALTVHPHPTLSESVAFAAEVFEGTITDLYLSRT